MKPLKFIHITKTAGSSIENLGIKNNIEWGKFHIEYGSRWHTPFLWIKNYELKQKYDWFTVVRNPYDRLLSEFYWVPLFKKKPRFFRFYDPYDQSIESFNQKIRSFINTPLKHHWKYDFHYTPQYLYIDNSTTIHIIKFENLKKEFDSLMKSYDINLTLDIHTNTSNKFYSIDHFDSDTIALINKVYDQDFIMFNYDKR